MAVPYLSEPCCPSRKFTLVLDLDETLIHFNEAHQKKLLQKSLQSFVDANERLPS